MVDEEVEWRASVRKDYRDERRFLCVTVGMLVGTSVFAVMMFVALCACPDLGRSYVLGFVGMLGIIAMYVYGIKTSVDRLSRIVLHMRPEDVPQFEEP